MAKIALLSHVLPPSPSGQAVALYRIFSGFPSDSYYLISSDGNRAAPQASGLLSAPNHVLPAEVLLSTPDVIGLKYIRSFINLLILVARRTWNLVEILKRIEPETCGLIACTGNVIDIPSGFLASRIARIPFYAYIFDDYVFQWGGNKQFFSRSIAWFVFRNSSGIIGPNEFICAEYKKRYGVNVTMIRNPCDLDGLTSDEASLPWPVERNKIELMYAGAIYRANYECFRSLIRAMAELPEFPLQLHIYTAQRPDQMELQGIRGPQVFVHAHLPYGDILSRQRNADILFLPLAFDESISEVIHTSAPGKLGEYLASGRPILAHVPDDSFVADYFRKHRCGFVASQNDWLDLAARIRELVASSQLRAEFVENARRQASLDFSPLTAQRQLAELTQPNCIGKPK